MHIQAVSASSSLDDLYHCHVIRADQHVLVGPQRAPDARTTRTSSFVAMLMCDQLAHQGAWNQLQPQRVPQPHLSEASENNSILGGVEE